MNNISNQIQSFPLSIRKTLQKYTRLPKDISNTFYHFTSRGGLEGIIKDGGIRATYRKHMNDDMEFEYAKNIIFETLSDIETRSDLPKAAQNISKQVKLNLKRHLSDAARMSSSFCSCLTCSFNDPRQWETYAENGYGFALGFNLLEILGQQRQEFKTENPFIFCYPVLYDKTNQQNLVAELILAG